MNLDIIMHHAMNAPSMRECEIASQVESLNTGKSLSFQHKHIFLLTGKIQVIIRTDDLIDIIVLTPEFSGMRTIAPSDYANAQFIASITDQLMGFARQSLFIRPESFRRYSLSLPALTEVEVF